MTDGGTTCVFSRSLRWALIQLVVIAENRVPEA
jgi:hypothetical protein